MEFMRGMPDGGRGTSMPHKGTPSYLRAEARGERYGAPRRAALTIKKPGLPAHGRASRKQAAYLVNPQKTSRIIPSSFSVRVSPTR